MNIGMHILHSIDPYFDIKQPINTRRFSCMFGYNAIRPDKTCGCSSLDKISNQSTTPSPSMHMIFCSNTSISARYISLEPTNMSGISHSRTNLYSIDGEQKTAVTKHPKQVKWTTRYWSTPPAGSKTDDQCAHSKVDSTLVETLTLNPHPILLLPSQREHTPQEHGCVPTVVRGFNGIFPSLDTA